MKTSFVTPAVYLTVFLMALVPTADAKLTRILKNGPSEPSEERKLKSGKKGGKKGGSGPSCFSRQAVPDGECNGNQQCADENDVCGEMKTTFQCDCKDRKWLCRAIHYEGQLSCP
jgi:hypothetical protein